MTLPVHAGRRSLTLSPGASGDAELLAATRMALAPFHARAGDLIFNRPPCVSAQATIHFLGLAKGPPLYVAKMRKPGCGAPSAARQYRALRRCHAGWAAEDRHSVAKPVALLANGDGFLMEYVSGDNLARVLPQALFQADRGIAASMAAGDFLRRLHRRDGVEEIEVGLRDLVAEIRASQAGEFQRAGLVLPAGVERTLDRMPDIKRVTRRVLLHGDYTPRNLIRTGEGQVAMIDPILETEGLAEDDVASFLTLMSSASPFAAGLVSPHCRRTRLRLERAFLTGYGASNISPVVCGLRLLHEQMWRWTYRRLRVHHPWEDRLSALRTHIIDAQMRAMLEETALALEASLAAIRPAPPLGHAV